MSKTDSRNKSLSRNKSMVSSNKSLSSNKTMSSNKSMSSICIYGTSGNGSNNLVVVLGTSMDWYWYWVRDGLGIGYIYWDGYWFGNGVGNLDLLDLRLGVLDNGTGMVGSINKVGDVLLYLDFLGLNCDLWGIVGHLREEDRGRSDGRGRQGRLVDGGGGTSNIGLCTIVCLLVDGYCHMLLGDWNLDLLRGKGNSILLWSWLDNMVLYSNLSSTVTNYSSRVSKTNMCYSNIMGSTQSHSNHAEKYQILHNVSVEC